jgi:peptidoglycan/LPS O-acetylase OafA/YrhL
LTRDESLYLDLIRFLAALVVFTDHYSSARLTAGLLWQLQPYGHIAVMAFFVLSGFVISYVTTEKETMLSSYSIARLARLYSVALPAVIIGIILDAIGRSIQPSLYTHSWGYANDYPFSRVLASLTFTSQLWFHTISTFSNLSFWSLPYEFWYYVLFGIALFFRGKTRVVLCAITALIIGPRILFLFPVWLMGVAAHRLVSAVHLSRWLAWCIFAGSLAGLVAIRLVHVPWLGIHTDELLPATIKQACCRVPGGGLLGDYCYGLLFAMNFAAFNFMGTLSWLPATIGRCIRLLAGATFSIYLFHMPVLQFLAAISPWAKDATVHRILMYVLGLGLCLIFAFMFETRRRAWRSFFALVIPTSEGHPVVAKNSEKISFGSVLKGADVQFMKR